MFLVLEQEVHIKYIFDEVLVVIVFSRRLKVQCLYEATCRVVPIPDRALSQVFAQVMA